MADQKEKDQRENQQLALQGGMKAVSSIEGKGEAKIGVEEFISLAERFGFSETALAEMRELAQKELSGDGPFLANYYSGLEESKTQAFQRVARATFGTKYALGVSSGSGALHAAFVAVGVGPGTEVICPAIGFYATAAAVVMARGVPIFCDVDQSLGMDPQKIKPLINSRTVAIAPTHIMGSVCDMDPVMELARKHDLKVVEDCAQCCGGEYRGRQVGSIGDVGIFSISSYKIVGGGEGGLLITDDDLLWNRANCLVEGGGLWREDRFAPPKYEGELFVGTNYRMSELEAAVDVVQLEKMGQVVARFRRVKKNIVSQLKRFREITPQISNDFDGDVGYLLRFYPESFELGEKLVEALGAEGVGCGMRGPDAPPDWHIYHDMYPVTLKTGATELDRPFDDPIYVERGGHVEYNKGDCPVADDLHARTISVSLNQWYSEDDCANISLGLNKVFSAFCTEDSSAQTWTG